jgi:hypothetical protein
MIIFRLAKQYTVERVNSEFVFFEKAVKHIWHIANFQL